MPTSNSTEGGEGLPVAAPGPAGTLLRSVALLKWPGAAAVAAGVGCFPMLIWFSGPWAVLALLLVMGGCVLLVAALRAQQALAPPAPADSAEPGDSPGAG